MHAAWRYLLGCDADIALLQEAVLPPDDVAGRIEVDPASFHDVKGHRISRTAIVKLSDRVQSDRIKVEWLEPVPIAEAGQLDFVFASEGMADSIQVRALNGVEEWGPSDHCRIEIVVA